MDSIVASFPKSIVPPVLLYSYLGFYRQLLPAAVLKDKNAILWWRPRVECIMCYNLHQRIILTYSMFRTCGGFTHKATQNSTVVGKRFWSIFFACFVFAFFIEIFFLKHALPHLSLRGILKYHWTIRISYTKWNFFITKVHGKFKLEWKLGYHLPVKGLSTEFSHGLMKKTFSTGYQYPIFFNKVSPFVEVY